MDLHTQSRAGSLCCWIFHLIHLLRTPPQAQAEWMDWQLCSGLFVHLPAVVSAVCIFSTYILGLSLYACARAHACMCPCSRVWISTYCKHYCHNISMKGLRWHASWTVIVCARARVRWVHEFMQVCMWVYIRMFVWCLFILVHYLHAMHVDLYILMIQRMTCMLTFTY
jgi:hypothetical protein